MTRQTDTRAVTVVDVTTTARWLMATSLANRTVYGVALGIFVGVYFFLVIPSDYAVQPIWIVLQPIILLAAIVAWRATGHAIRPLGVVAIGLVTLFALAFLQVMAALLTSRTRIIEYSERFPDPQWHALISAFGPNAVFTFFLTIYAIPTVLLVVGVVAALVLRWRQIPELGTTLAAADRSTRAVVARAGDAPRLVRWLALSRRKGWLAAVAALMMLILPVIMFAGREGVIPGATGVEGTLPTAVARIVTLLNDRAVVVPFAIVGALLLWRLARWYGSPDGRFVLAADERAPILLLRSFKDDHATLQPSDLWRWLLHPLVAILRFLAMQVGARDVGVALGAVTRRRLEEVAAGSLRPLGPFIAVGDRNDNAPQLGAVRVTLGDDWKSYVETWLKSSRLVVMVAGLTPWVRWELRTAAELGLLDKVVLLMPPTRSAEAAERWAFVVESLAGTSWAPALRDVEPEKVRAVLFAAGGRLIVVRSASPNERAYDLAIRIGSMLVIQNAAPG